MRIRMKTVLVGLVIFLSSYGSTFVSASSEMVALVDWLNSFEGGFYNPKQEIRRQDPLDPGSYFGVFAKERIEEDELLSRVPWEAIISEDGGVYDDDEQDETPLSCGTVRNIAKEMRLGEKSKYAPYVLYLQNQRDGQLPSAWSEEGKLLFEDVLGGKGDMQRIPPSDATTWLEDWYEFCHGDPEDEMAARAAMLVLQRSDDDLMVPVYDLYNHRNGHWFNTKSSQEREEGHEVRARRTIEAGEEIFNSYNLCDECESRHHGYGTPDLFRDYGFIENYPQRWIFGGGTLQFDLEEDNEGNIQLVWDEEDNPENTDKPETAKKFQRELRRLKKVKSMAWHFRLYEDGNNVPEHEWNLVWEYHQAITDAISYAINDMVGDNEKVPVLGGTRDGVCSGNSCGNHYDDLEEEEDDLDYVNPTCDNDELLSFPDYDLVETVRSTYQLMSFQDRESPLDMCMDLDETLQICSSYRPHYHEFAAHFPARYIETVKRVIFVGGGDSMLLHEVLKYPSLELVVGLELDQVVTRKSFKFFNTQPHFDDERVEWWFGDATKSLLMLPKDYWQSFDLVLVDLSETVMAFTVTEELEVFDALALLLKPDGVMVKNELYMEAMSTTFDYTLQISYESPKICSQVMVFGSNRVDFFHQTMKDHHVETKLLMPPVHYEDPFEYMHDYRKNDARAQGKCRNIEKEKTSKDERQEKSAGILFVLDAEHTGAFSKESLQENLYSILRREGLTPVSFPSKNKDGKVATVVMKEGYVVARMWPEYNYCAFDLNLWGGFHKTQNVRAALLKAVGNPHGTGLGLSVSSFRVIVGGMFGYPAWKEDQKFMGPQIVQTRKCDEEELSGEPLIEEVVARVAVNEIVNLVHSERLNVAVLCGNEEEDECSAADALEKHTNVFKVTSIWSCPDLDRAEDNLEKVSKMYNCEKHVMHQLAEALDPDYSKLNMFVVDGSASFEMGQIMSSIWSIPRNRFRWLEEHNVFSAIAANSSEKNWRRHFLDRYRKDVKNDPVTRAEIVLKGGEISMELGLVSVGDEFIFLNLRIFEQTLRQRLSTDMVVDVELQKINGGLWPRQEDFNPEEYSPADYDQKPAKEQFAKQKPLGRESVFQLELVDKEGVSMPTLEQLLLCLEKTFAKLRMVDAKSERYEDLGDGGVVVSVSPKGSAVLSWDGRNHVGINLFSYNDRLELADSFVSSFVSFTGKKLKVVLRDDFPRGTGRVINFQEDLKYVGF